jgi:hypothetical protein
MVRILELSRCDNNCPFFQEGCCVDEGAYCDHPSAPAESNIIATATKIKNFPNWCPLEDSENLKKEKDKSKERPVTERGA